MLAYPLSTLRRPPHDGPTHDSGPRLVASLFHVVDFHHLPSAGFYRRFRSDPYILHDPYILLSKLVFLRFYQLWRLFVVVLLPGDAFYLRLDIAK